jgi:hypothetical protein
VARHEDFAGLAKKYSNANCFKPDISVVSPDDISESAKEEVRQFESGKKIYKINRRDPK